MEKVKLDSGKELSITAAPFETSKELFQVVMGSMQGIKFDGDAEMDINFFKELFVVAASSKKIEEHIWACMDKCLLDKTRITKEMFEDEKLREDYMDVMFHVARVNIRPFMKNLFAKLRHLMSQAMGIAQG